MTAFFVATSHIKDPQKFAEYGAKAGSTLASFGGKLVLRGKAEDALSGHCDHHAIGIIQFSKMDDLKAWFKAPAYQALIPLRNEAADMTLVTYEVPA